MKKLLFAIGWLVVVSQTVAADASPSSDAHPKTRLLRHPTWANGKVAFSYLGDIWIANDDGSGARRLTDHKARDVFPRFSPDGKWVAFSSDRQGNYDVYVVAVEGGKPLQLTFHTANDLVVGWTPDGRQVIFQSARNQGVFPGIATLFTVSREGGLEKSMETDWGSWASYSPDGSKLAFTRHPGVWSRKHYRGNYAVDLWVEDLATKMFTRLGQPDYKGNYLWPMYRHDGEIYYVADPLPDEEDIQFGGPAVMKSVNNIWKISEHGGEPVQVTHHTDGSLFFPSLSADGKIIVYEDSFGLWKLETESGQTTQIPIDIQSDWKENETDLRTIQSEADAFHLSPSTKRAAIVAHGEIFTIATDRGEPQRVTETSWREKEPRWSANGKWIAFVSDRTGREEVWMADELAHQLKQLSDVDCDKTSLAWSPDSKSLLWSGSDHKLRRVEIAEGKTEEVASSEAGPITTPQFSPDGKWISYAKPDALLRSHVYIKPVESGEEREVKSDEYLMSSGAKWTPDGKKLLLLGGIGAPAMSSLNRTPMQLYSVALQRLEKNPDEQRDINTEDQAEAAPETPRRGRGAVADGESAGRSDTPEGESDTPRRGRGAGARTNAPVEVKIEWDGLARRIRKLTSLAGSVTVVVPAPDSRTYALVAQGGGSGGEESGGGPALYTIAEDGTRLMRINTGTAPSTGEGTPRGRGGARGGGFGEPQWSKDGRTIYYLQGGGIYSVAAPAAPSGDGQDTASGGGGRGGRGGRGGSGTGAAADSTATPRRISFTVRMEVDEAAERRQVFEEAWRVMKNRFYDPKMHGVDWAAAKRTYEPLLANIADADELHNVIMQMIGELNASHTGISGGADPGQGEGQERIQTRYPGFELAPQASGHYQVSYIYKKGPADHDYVKLAVGNYVLALNGKELKTTDNYWRRFNLIPGRKFEFTVNSKPEMAGAWPVSLEPVTPTAQSNLEYER
jgi:tricorn protease